MRITMALAPQRPSATSDKLQANDTDMCRGARCDLRHGGWIVDN